jgi:hypothetical protein
LIRGIVVIQYLRRRQGGGIGRCLGVAALRHQQAAVKRQRHDAEENRERESYPGDNCATAGAAPAVHSNARHRSAPRAKAVKLDALRGNILYGSSTPPGKEENAGFSKKSGFLGANCFAASGAWRTNPVCSDSADFAAGRWVK